MTAALTRHFYTIALVVLGLSLLGTFAWAFVTLPTRPLDGVEGDVLFEADRIRAGLPLYVDPLAGAAEYGEPPARYLVLYPPLWSAALSLLPRGVAFVGSRVLASLAWFGALGLLVWRAPSERRRTVFIAASFVAGIWVLALYGASGRPDAAAVFFSAFATERVARRSAEPSKGAAFDVIAGIAFALAAWIKPNVVGAFPGAVVGCLFAARGDVRRRITNVLPGIAAMLVVSTAIAATLHFVSHGTWVTHLLASTGQPPNASLWLEQLLSRGPFFLLPLLASLWVGVRQRRDPGALVAACALATSLGWALLSLAKTGSATNYYLEPCVTMLVVLSRVDLPAARPVTGLVLSALALGQVAWTGLASIHGSTEGRKLAATRAAVLANARETCGSKPSDLVIADEPGLELALDGRIVMTPFQTTHRVRRGQFSEELWRHDLGASNVTCLVMQDDLLERPLSDERVAHDRFPSGVRRALRERFVLAEKAGGWFVYRLRRTARP